MAYEIYDTAELIGVVEELPVFEPFLLQMMFPNVMTFVTEEVDLELIPGNHKLAPFCSPIVAGKVQKTKGGEVKKFKPAYVKPKNVVKPADVMQRKAGEKLGGSMTPAQRRDVSIVKHLDDQRGQILKRLEWMASEIARTGKVTIEGEDYPKVEVDFGRKAALTIQLTGTDLWTDTANTKPSKQVNTWGKLLDGPIKTLIFSSSAWELFADIPSVDKLLDTRRGSRTTMELGPDGGELVSFKGWFGADIECWVYSGWYEDENDVQQNFIPDDYVFAGSKAIDGVRCFGAIHDAEAGYEAMEYFPKNWVEKDPSLEYIMTQSSPLLVPKRVNTWVSVKVTL